MPKFGIRYVYLVSEDHSLTNLRSSYTKPVIGKSEELAGLLGA